VRAAVLQRQFGRQCPRGGDFLPGGGNPPPACDRASAHHRRGDPAQYRNWFLVACV